MKEIVYETVEFQGTEEEYIAALVDFAAKYNCTLVSNENVPFSLLTPDGGQLTTGIIRRQEEQTNDRRR